MTNSLLYNDSGRLERSDERNLPTWREYKPCYADCGNEYVCSETKLCADCLREAKSEDDGAIPMDTIETLTT